MKRLAAVVVSLLIIFGGVSAYIAFPDHAILTLPTPLAAYDDLQIPPTTQAYFADYNALASGFRSQQYRSYCGPSSLATVLRAYGVADVDQRRLFPSVRWRAAAFFTGMTLAELHRLAAHVALRTTIIHADTLTVEAFRQVLKDNLSVAGDYLIINYDRRVLNQAGAGHISTIAGYDIDSDRALVLDQAAYKYPFTWIPVPLLFDSMYTLDGDVFRGLLQVHGRLEAERAFTKSVTTSSDVHPSTPS